MYVEMEYSKNSIKLDDGTNKKAQYLKDESGQEIKFRTLVGALNYMSLSGWDLVDTKSITHGSGSGGISVTGTSVYYIFCKDVSEDELKQVVADSYRD